MTMTTARQKRKRILGSSNREVVCAVVTQKAEDPTFNRCDAGSTPAGGTKRVATDCSRGETVIAPAS